MTPPFAAAAPTLGTPPPTNHVPALFTKSRGPTWTHPLNMQLPWKPATARYLLATFTGSGRHPRCQETADVLPEQTLKILTNSGGKRRQVNPLK